MGKNGGGQKSESGPSKGRQRPGKGERGRTDVGEIKSESGLSSGRQRSGRGEWGRTGAGKKNSNQDRGEAGRELELERQRWRAC